MQDITFPLDWAHPRLRGAHEYHATRACVDVGSSPLTRGARLDETWEGLSQGLIPAYAGRTLSDLEFSWVRSRFRTDLRHRAVPPMRVGAIFGALVQGSTQPALGP